MSFLEEQLPTDIRPAMSGGARFSTEIKMGRSGHEFRNRRWAEPLREFSVSFGARDTNRVLEILQFGYRTAGSWLGFRMKDWVDYKSCPPTDTPNGSDLSLGVGDGTTFYFPLNKTYGSQYTRRITKPIADTIIVKRNGAVMTRDVNYFVDDVNGVIVFVNPQPSGAVLTWGGEFDVPVRFEDDVIETLSFYYAKGQTGNIGLREIRIKEDIDLDDYAARRAAL